MHNPSHPPLTVEALANWLQNQQKSFEYSYQDPAHCLLGWYLRANGADLAIAETLYEQFPQYREIAAPKPHTFGAALERAKTLALPAPQQSTQSELLPLPDIDIPAITHTQR